jgi:alpha-beta hydrolase superfamily lysophospholipase
MLQSDSLVISGSQAVSKKDAAKSDVPLFIDCWQGKEDAKQSLLILHGLGEHGGRYRHVPTFLGERFARFYAMDQRGHGRSGGLRGYAPSFQTLVDDLLSVASEIKAREGDKKLFLLAHSFGGLVALNLLLKERRVPFAGAAISAPLLGVTLKVPAYKKLLGELLGRTLSKVQLTNEINPSYLSHDPAIVEAYVNDRLVHEKITPRLYLDMCAAMDWVNAQSGPLACPTLFLLPGDDRIVDSGKTRALFQGLKYRDKELREYPEMYHEILNEVEKAKVFSDIESWLERNFGGEKA